MNVLTRQEEIRQAIHKRETDAKCKFKDQDAIVVIDGPYRGWIGYAQGNEDGDGYLKVKLFAHDGEIASTDELPAEYVKNIEPEPRLPMWDY